MIEIKLAHLLSDINMSQRQLARLTGIRPNTINAYCRGIIRRIEIEDLNKICETINCQVSDLFVYQKGK